jgi:hypothetical protein
MRAAASDPLRQLVLQSDLYVPHARIVSLMQRAKAAGFTRMAIATTGSSPLRPYRLDGAAGSLAPLDLTFRMRLLIERGGFPLQPIEQR